MKIVFKYLIPTRRIKDRFSLDLPQGAQILTVGEQYGNSTIWALINPENETETRNFILVNTGHPIEENSLNYIGTSQSPSGGYVGHLFEIK